MTGKLDRTADCGGEAAPAGRAVLPPAEQLSVQTQAELAGVLPGYLQHQGNNVSRPRLTAPPNVSARH
jgi:hypothetical protein